MSTPSWDQLSGICEAIAVFRPQLSTDFATDRHGRVAILVSSGEREAYFAPSQEGRYWRATTEAGVAADPMGELLDLGTADCDVPTIATSLVREFDRLTGRAADPATPPSTIGWEGLVDAVLGINQLPAAERDEVVATWARQMIQILVYTSAAVDNEARPGGTAFPLMAVWGRYLRRQAQLRWNRAIPSSLDELVAWRRDPWPPPSIAFVLVPRALEQIWLDELKVRIEEATSALQALAEAPSAARHVSAAIRLGWCAALLVLVAAVRNRYSPAAAQVIRGQIVVLQHHACASAWLMWKHWPHDELGHVLESVAAAITVRQ